MRYKLHALAFLLIGLMFLVQTAAGMVQLGITDSNVYHPPNKSLDINISIRYDEFLPQTSTLRVLFNSTLQETINLDSYLHGESYYEYKSHPFSYNITADGENRWEEYPNVTFSYTLTVQGKRGPPACTTDWTANYQPGEFDTVNRQEGLSFIISDPINPPADDCPENKTWFIQKQLQSPSSFPAGMGFELTMRQACGNSFYGGIPTEFNGWVIREINVTRLGCTGVPLTTDWECYIHKFDNESLKQGYRIYGGPISYLHGGIYKGSTYQPWSENGVKWEGNTGYIKIYNHDEKYDYFMVYLPGNGPRVCAYTNYTDVFSSQWTRETTVQGVSARYLGDYQATWADGQLRSMLNFPDCPATGSDCNKTVSQYTVDEETDPDNAITVTSQFNQTSQALTVTGQSTLKDFTQNYTETVALGSHVQAPDSAGLYDISVSLFYGDGPLTRDSQFNVCEDLDGDGYCEERGDCNDTDDSINPDASETCDNVDNDCDGDVDEDFYGTGFGCVLNQSCNDWNGSVCSGTCVCTEDGTNVTCNSTYSPGDLEEICANGVDDDCDGETDEIYDLINGTDPTEGCIWKCIEGAKRPCGSDIGFCRPGNRTCINGTWDLACVGAVWGRDEICNLALQQLARYADDDCDGVIDNVFGGTSIQETKCGCYDGDPPEPEICNGVDDDCDGTVDEMACACSIGETRNCGNEKGICEPGIQYCVDGWWEINCTGGKGPDPSGEICYNDLDDDCDGYVDEDCLLVVTCRNGLWDMNEEGIDCGGECSEISGMCEYPITWLIVAAVVICFIILFIVLEIKGKIPV